MLKHLINVEINKNNQRYVTLLQWLHKWYTVSCLRPKNQGLNTQQLSLFSVFNAFAIICSEIIGPDNSTPIMATKIKFSLNKDYVAHKHIASQFWQ